MKIGFLVKNLLPSQLNFLLIKSLNQKVVQDSTIAPTIFYENVSRPCLNPLFPIMNIVDGYSFDGPLVATTLSTAEKLLIFPSPIKKYFLCWDVEWIRLQRKDFRSLLTIYGNKDLTLVCRSKDHQDLIKTCWNRDSLLFSDFTKYE